MAGKRKVRNIFGGNRILPPKGSRGVYFDLPIGNKASKYIIYAVVLKEHQNIVKIGRTTNWNNRKKQYEGWNLSLENAIYESMVYCITEEYVDLERIESACLCAMNKTPYRGKEWFIGSMNDAEKAIELVLSLGNVSYIKNG